MASRELEAIAQGIAKMMTQAAGVSTAAEITQSDGTMMSAYFAVAGDVAHFSVDTPFGWPVRVTVSKAGGMFA